ncbi:MAG: DUF2191 domain-containing protein [Gemmatimonadota bacterium]|nr:DUF2191 domain-containing protein [Gemmatimonadota bacterium]
MTSNLTSGNLKGQLPCLWIYYMLLCMKTTIQLDDQLLLEAKKHAAQTGRTLKAVIEDALREALTRTEASRSQTRVPLKTFKGRGVQSGVDLDDTSSLLDSMERDGSPA